MKKLVLVLSLILVSITFCSKDKGTDNKATTPEDLLLKNNDIAGWTASGEHWTASSNSELYEAINGGSEVYTTRGFVEAANQNYNGIVLDAAASIQLQIYDQGKEANAKAVFDEIVNQITVPIDWPEVGKAAKVERYPLSQRIVFYKSKYFISLSITSGLDEALEILKTFAKSVDSKI